MKVLKGKRLLVVVIGLTGVVAGVGWWVSHRPATTHQQSAQATYYCPMHPTYTSDKPGDCPICNMKLVKREEARAAPATPSPTAPQDICYMHNCPKVHEGQPCPMLVVAKVGEKVTCPICGTHVTEGRSTTKKILYWTDPMLPGYQSDQPGKSPMGMELVPVYEEETHRRTSTQAPEGYTPILVTPQKQQLIGIKTATVERRQLAKTIRAVGTVAHDPELYQAQAEYLEAVNAAQRIPATAPPETRAQAERLAGLSRVKLKHLGFSDALIEELGTLEHAEHSLLYGGQGGRVWIYGAIYEYELPLVQVGTPVTVELAAMVGQPLNGTVRSIDPMVDPTTRTARIRVLVEDTAALLKPEMYVNLTIVAERGEALVVPKEAVLQTGTQHILFVDKGQGLFEPRDVRVGTAAGDVVEIQSGVAAGERVVTSGNFLIDSESRLKGALEGMGGGGHQHGE